MAFESDDLCLEYFSTLMSYHQRAKDLYTKDKDPVGYSRMILTCSALVAVIDALNCSFHPLLKQYSCGFNPSPVMKSLLMRKNEDINYALEVSEYFKKRNNNSLPMDITSRVSDERGFGAQYAKNDSRMQNVRTAVLDLEQKAITAKLEEVQKQKAIRQELLDESSLMPCNCVIVVDEEIQCRKCKMNYKAKKMSVKIFEHYLPSVEWEQNTVIFELLMPKSLSLLRDALHFLNTKVCGGNYNGQKMSSRCLWREHHFLKRYIRDSREPKYINLMTTKGGISSSHVSYQRVSSDISCFVQKCTFNLRMNVDGLNGELNVSTKCAFELENAYKCLQFALTGWSHNQNIILAGQANCSEG
eukprot:TRINITY_DN822_c0_g1_i1.p1 TRINITY_DN822_c0_g1~~TRINITY_DN822_c0_g1_i1.p1  ORF type:complete len:366 (-),score=116.63 TRINITY_DN822_c0_g1_i1:1575-2648(-)